MSFFFFFFNNFNNPNQPNLILGKTGLGKQRRPRSDALKGAVWSGSTLAAIPSAFLDTLLHGKTSNEPRQANLCLHAFCHDKTAAEWLRMPSHSERPGTWLSGLKVPLDSLLVWASSGGSGETARVRRLAWTFAARIGDKYQIRLTRSKFQILG